MGPPEINKSIGCGRILVVEEERDGEESRSECDMNEEEEGRLRCFINRGVSKLPLCP